MWWVSTDRFAADLAPGQGCAVLMRVLVLTLVGTATVAGRAAVIPQVTGTVHRTGTHSFVVGSADPLVPGFVLR